MTIFRPIHWTLCCLAAALAIAGCTSETTSGETTGSLSLNLELLSDDVINQVDWTITGGDMEPMGGSIDTSAPGATASVEVFGLPPDDDYVVELEATSEDRDTTCKGSAEFEVEIGQTTDVMVILNCKLPRTLGGVRVNGKFNICTELIKATAAPLETSVGNDIDLTSQAEDAEDDDITYSWTATGGTIDDPSAASTTYTCVDAGKHTITISVTDNDEVCDMATWMFPVRCVLGEAECMTDDDCDENEVCEAGQCVLDIECVTPADCDDENDCTANICADGTCANPNSDIDEMCDQDGGSVCDGQGGCVECNSDMQCDAGEVCTENACVADVECDVDSECDDENDCTVDVCTAGECSNDNDEPGATCDQGGGSVCDGQGNCVECNGDANCGMGEVCLANMCVADVECMENDDCSLDEICVANACVSDPDVFCNEGLCETNDTARMNCVEAFLVCLAAEPLNEEECIVLGLAQCNVECLEDNDCEIDEVCTNNECEAAAECNMDIDCADGNECTNDVCTAGMCSNPNTDPDEMCNQDGGSVCDGLGACVECNASDQCPADVCQVATCIDNGCGTVNAQDGAVCDGGSGECQAGVCEPLGPATFDLSASVFVAYNTLLPFNPGVCDDPDLNAGGTQCVKVFPPDIRGPVELTETTPGNWDVHIEQTLNSTIPARLEAFNADVIINANSLTVLDGTGTGSVPGTITLDTFADAVGTQNMVVDAAFPGAGGTAQCLAIVQTGAEAPCNLTGGCSDPLVPCSECLNSGNGQTCGNLVANECDPVDASGPLTNPLAVCNLAGLPITSCTQWPFNGLALEDSGCFYDLPTSDDNLARLLPNIVVAGTSLQLDGGPTVAGGYYRANAYDPSAGPQWIALAGVQQ